MATAKATCTCATCGRTFEHWAIKRNRREADSYVEWAEAHITQCHDCEEAEIQRRRAEKSAESAESARKAGWPALAGTEKQIAWAETIRREMADLLGEYFDKSPISRRAPKACASVRKAYFGILVRHESARWWIDHRTGNIREILRLIEAEDKEKCAACVEACRTDTPLAEEEAPAQREAPRPERPIAVPENQMHKGVVELMIRDGQVDAGYPKDETFREIVKGMGFSWINGAWSLRIGEKTGTGENICAELGNKLLNSGYSVRFDTQAMMDAAVAGDYTPRHMRWIGYLGGFRITWGRSDDLYREAKALPGARYDAPGIVVPETSWDAVADFAERYDFRYTAKAQEQMDRLCGAAEVVAPAAPKEPEYREKDVLQSSREVLDDLIDE